MGHLESAPSQRVSWCEGRTDACGNKIRFSNQWSFKTQVNEKACNSCPMHHSHLTTLTQEIKAIM